MTGEAEAPVRDVLRHDLHTELHHVVGYAQLALGELGGTRPDGLDPLLRQICAHAGRAASGDASFPDVAEALAAMNVAVAEMQRRTAAGADEFLIRDVERITVAADNAQRITALLLQRDLPPRVTPIASAPDEAGVILVVDDDADTCDLLARSLERLGYAVLVAEDGHQALGVLECEPVDLVLLDLMMPEMDGEAFLIQRQADERLRDIPVVMMSATQGGVAGIAHCIELGADDYLPKPFEPGFVALRVRVCLEKKRRRKAGSRPPDHAHLANVERRAWLRRFVPPSVADVILSSADGVLSSGTDDCLRSHRGQISVLSGALIAFTAYAEVAEPDAVMRVLRAYHDAVGHLSEKYEATVGLLAGDRVMAFFGDPRPCPNPAEQALRMGLALHDRVQFVIRDGPAGGAAVGFGIGISVGPATLGESGFDRRPEYGAIGSVVDVAWSLCARARHADILLTAAAYAAVADLAVGEEIGPMTTEACDTPVGVFKVFGLKAPAGTTKER